MEGTLLQNKSCLESQPYDLNEALDFGLLSCWTKLRFGATGMEQMYFAHEKKMASISTQDKYLSHILWYFLSHSHNC
jgi:hypothetical protein